MPSAFPFTYTFLAEAVEKLKSTVLKSEYERLAFLRQTIIDAYSDWAEKELKNVPDFLRRFTNKIYFEYTEKKWYEDDTVMSKYIFLDEGQRLPLVPGYEHSGAGKIVVVKNVCLDYMRLDKKLGKIYATRNTTARQKCNRYVTGGGLNYQQILTDENGNEYERPKYKLIGLDPEYQDFLESQIPAYEQSIRDSVNQLITGEKPQITEKKESSEPVQLEFVF